MFSPSVLNELNTTQASFKFDSIKEICVQLAIDAQEEGILEQSPDEINSKANDFVESFATNNGLTVHTIAPLSWRFDIENKQAFDDGIVELRLNGRHAAYFVYIDVANVKITGPTLQKHDVQMHKGHVIDLDKEILKRLSAQLEEWKSQLIFVDEKSREQLDEVIAYMEVKIHEISHNTKELSRDALREYRKMWHDFEHDFMGRFNKK